MEEMIQIPKWQLKEIEDTLRITSMVNKCQTKETCFDRCVCKAWDFAKSALANNVSTKQEQQCNIGAVSGSLSADDVKWLVMYGYNKDKTIDIRSEDKGELDYAISNMFQILKDSTRFDAERVERVFWERVSALANYR